MIFERTYNLFGVRIWLTTDSVRIREVAISFLGAHEVSADGPFEFRFELRETASMPDIDCPTLRICRDREYQVLERGGRTFFSVAEGIAFLDEAQRTASGWVLPVDGGRVHPAGSVSLLHLLTVRAMFAAGFLPMHAGAVRWNGGLLLLAGENGAGKSTLSVEFARWGQQPAGDDLVYLAVADGKLLAGAHRQPFKLIASEAPSDLAPTQSSVRVSGKTLLPQPGFDVKDDNELRAVTAVVWLEKTPEREASATVRSDCTAEALFHLIGDSPKLNTPEYTARAFDWLSSAGECPFLIVRPSRHPDRTVAAILHALDPSRNSTCA